MAVAAGATLLALGAASTASASHLQGGYFTANVTAEGRLQGTLTYLEVQPCASGIGTQKTLPISIKAPSGQTVTKNVATVATRCLAGGSTYTGSFDVPLASTFTTAADGAYVLEWTAGNRIYGIVNVADSGNTSVRFRARVRKVTGVATAAPFLGSDVATGIGIGELYSQNLNAYDADDVLGNQSLTYATVNGAAELGPTSDVISLPKLTAGGQIEIPASQTSTFADKSKYVYKVRVTDAQGDFAERDVLLTATTPNRTPVINGLDTTSGYDVADGTTRTIDFDATDPDTGDVVTLSGASLPSWATLTQTPGNPARARLVLAPPADANTRTYRLNFDAVDDDGTQPLTGSRTVEVRVKGAPETLLRSMPAALSPLDTGTFTFEAADPSSAFECRLDAAAWTPCASGTPLTGLSDGRHAFQVRADDGSRVDPSPASYTWTVDTTAPTTTFLTKPAAATTSTRADFGFATDETGPVTYTCSLDGAAPAACTPPVTTTGLAEGPHVLRVVAKDALGHVESPAAEHAWTVDRTAPDTTLVEGPPTRSASTSASFSLTATEPGTFECRIDGAAWAACTAPVALTGLAEGGHTVLLRAVDAAGNADPTPVEVTWTVDTTAPRTTVGAATAPLTTATTAETAFSADDPDARFECRLDGGSWAACTTPDVRTGLADGDHALEVRATDLTGNQEATPARHEWRVDTAAPTTTLGDGAPRAQSPSSSAAFSFSADDEDATFTCSLDGGAWTRCADGASFDGLTDGEHEFRVRATDAAGNVEARPTTHRWTVDTTPPATPGERDVRLPVPGSSVREALVGFDDVPAGERVECRVDGGDWTTCTSPVDLSALADGEHTVELRAVDAAGNASAGVRGSAFTIDTVAPEAPVVVDGPTGTSGPATAFGFTHEPGASAECRLDGGAWTPCVSPARLDGLAIGPHEWQVRVTDAAGNVSAVRTERWTVPAPARDGVPTATPEVPKAPARRPTARVDVSSTIAVDAGRPSVGCRVEGDRIERCEVGVWVRRSALGLARRGTAQDVLVRIGTGTTEGDGTTGRLGVKVVLNALGRRAMRRVGGVRAKVAIEVTAAGGAVLRSSRRIAVRPASQVVVPTDGLFRTGSAVVSPVGRAYLRAIAAGVRSATRVGCVGHTDAVGSPESNRRLGQARAETVCRYLSDLGVTAPKRTTSAGETQPRASNATARGRALNRRVELDLRYR